MRNRSEQTICAISTPPGTGGIAVIRLSGPKALLITRKIAPSLQKKQLQTHTAYFAKVKDSQNEIVDEAVFTYFAFGKSFTGEEVIEISCHGSEYIAEKIINILIDMGAVLAEKGEFTFRAFMNNRIDLVQAESVLSLIQSQNEASARVAVRQLQGDISKKYEVLESDLTWCLAHIEASIDFSSEGIEVVDPKILIQKLTNIKGELEKLVASYSSGRLIKEGIKTVLLGEPNVGKSSLLNLLAEDDKAIVTSVAGTTRDVINASVVFDGLKYTLSDTAGLRETTDVVEKIGVDRSQKEANRADIVLYVLDLTELEWSTAAKQIMAIKTPYLILLNKADLRDTAGYDVARKKLQKLIPSLEDHDIILTSNLDPQTRIRVLKAVKQKIGAMNVMETALLTSARQYEMSTYALEMLETSIGELNKNMGAEFTAMYLKECLLALQRILGHVFDDQIMDRVFKEFCLGK